MVFWISLGLVAVVVGLAGIAAGQALPGFGLLVVAAYAFRTARTVETHDRRRRAA
jgi:hypothetical protein